MHLVWSGTLAGQYMARNFEVLSSVNAVDWSLHRTFATNECPVERADTVSGWTERTKYIPHTHTHAHN